MVLEKLGIHLQKDETEPLSVTINKNQLKVDQRSTPKPANYKNAVGKHQGNAGRHWGRQKLLKQDPQSTGNNPQNRQVGLHQIKTFLNSKEHSN